MKYIFIILLWFVGCTPNTLTRDFGDTDNEPADMTQKTDLSGDAGTTKDSGKTSDVGTKNNTTKDTGGTEMTGEELYVTNCNACHGPDGIGGSQWAGSIQGFKDISPSVTTGVGTMSAIPALNAGKIAKIQTFLDSKAPATVDGKVKYAQECAGCHGIDGKGVEKRGIQLRYKDPGFSTFTTRNGSSYGSFEFSAKGMPKFAEAEVSDAHLTEMWAWLDGLPNEAAGEGLYKQFCDNCHKTGGGTEQNIKGKADSTGHIRNGHNAGEYDARTRYMTKWDESQISDDEIGKINAYVSAL